MSEDRKNTFFSMDFLSCKDCDELISQLRTAVRRQKNELNLREAKVLLAQTSDLAINHIPSGGSLNVKSLPRVNFLETREDFFFTLPEYNQQICILYYLADPGSKACATEKIMRWFEEVERYFFHCLLTRERLDHSLCDQLNSLLLSEEFGSNLGFLSEGIIKISQFFQAERTTIYLYSQKTDHLIALFAQELNLPSLTLKPGQGLAGLSFEKNIILIENQPYKNPDFIAEIDESSGFLTRNSMSIPLCDHKKPIGVLQILNKTSPFTITDIQTGKKIAPILCAILNTWKLLVSNQSAQSELDSLLETIPEVLYRLDENGRFEFVSHEVLKWGYIREELTGRHFQEIIHPVDFPNVARSLVLPKFHGKTTGDKKSPGLFDERRTGKRGTKKMKIRILPGPHVSFEEIYPGIIDAEMKVFHTEVNASGFWVKDHLGNHKFMGTIGIISDITEQVLSEKKLQSAREELIRAERFAGLGTLAAGIAHDFNNILAAIGLSTDITKMLLNSRADHQELHETITNIEEYVTKASDLTSRLLSLGRTNVSRIEMTKITLVLEDALSIMRSRFETTGIQLHTNFNGEIQDCLMDRGQLRDVLINLMTNSIHSMEERCQRQGLLSNQMKLEIDIHSNDLEIFIKVRDTGCGIDEKVLPKIFDPFFTTKNRDYRKGTGLGLSMVFSIISNHSGKIKVETKPLGTHPRNPGTTFQIWLPVKKDQGRIHEESNLKEHNLNMPANASIYLVDDENSILDLMQTILRSSGFTNVKTFLNGGEAIRHLCKEKNSPDLVITDVQMPPLDGIDLCKQLFKLEKAPHVIIISGKLSEEYIQTFTEMGITHFLHKPFRARSLLRAISACLEQGMRTHELTEKELEVLQIHN